MTSNDIYWSLDLGPTTSREVRKTYKTAKTEERKEKKLFPFLPDAHDEN